MALTIQIKGHEQINGLKAFLDPENFRKAVRAGLKYGADSGKVTAAKQVGTFYNLKAADIKQDMNYSLRVEDASVTYRFARRDRTLRAYGFKQNRTGVTGSIQKGKRLAYRRAFEHGGLIFQRTSSARYPLTVPKGPSIGAIVLGPQADHARQIQDEVIKRVNEQWITGVDRALSAAARRA